MWFHSSSPKKWSYGHLTGKGKPPKLGKQQESQCLFVTLCTVNVDGPGKNIYVYISICYFIYIFVLFLQMLQKHSRYNTIFYKTSVHCIEYHELKTVFIGHLNIIYLNDIA